MAWPPAARDCGGGSSAPPRPVSPWTCRASIGGRSSGAGLPGVTGTPSAPTNSLTRWALEVVRSRPTLPATVVMPRRSISGLPTAKAMASASSMPGSQSRMIFLVTRSPFLRVRVPSGPSGPSGPSVPSGPSGPVQPPTLPDPDRPLVASCRGGHHAPAAHPARGPDRPRDRQPDRRGSAPGVREDPADPVGELRIGRRPRGLRFGADQQVLRGLPGPPLLRGPAVRGRHRDPGR